MSLRGVGYRLVQWLSVHLPNACAVRGAECVADLWWRCAAGRRAIVHQNLCMVLGTSTAQGSMSREVFRNFGRYLVEFFAIHTIRHPEVTLDGLQHLEDARHRQRGVIALTAHLGNWEMGAIMIRRMGVPTTVVAWPHGTSDMDRLFNQQRARCEINVIPMGADAARASLQCLRDGHLLGLLGDWEFTDHGLTLPVFERPVRLPRGPALLSLRSQAPVVPTFLIREGRWKFRLCFEPAIWPDPQGAEEPSIRRMTQRYARVLERYIQRFPEQWLMFHPIAGTT